MRQTTKSPGEKIVKDIKRATRKHYSSEEKIRIVLDGLRVADPSMELLTHWLMIQGALEGLAGEQACLNATDAELRHIEKLQSQMIDLAEQEDDLRRFDLDMEFHCAIVAAAHNPPLVETHQQYNSRLWRARYVSAKRQANRDQQMQKHQGIVDALLERDAAKASAALISHLRNAIENINASYSASSTEKDR